ncbi:unnamed protein product [Acanthoscelides obtectus]|uniref:Uncharacterized protein n=1 Tax=Acanthoscelides obtectus TaxID=200917 RepID=A0A9P0PI91_ACAOB|nr:unnamed protein product [Acanthoscelides obtectus]CAK1665978.1 hypothetical protein AOBTE_LOCUS25087 [Acanthoscelides obtectus]
MNFLILALTATLAYALPQFYDFDVEKSLPFELHEPLFDAPVDEKKDSSQKVSGSGSFVAKKFEPAPEAAFREAPNSPNLYYSPSAGRYKPLEELNPLEKPTPKKNKESPKFEGAASKFDEPQFKSFEPSKFDHSEDSYKPLEESKSFAPKFEYDEYGYSPKQSYTGNKPSEIHSHAKNSLPSYDHSYKPLEYAKTYVPKYDHNDYTPKVSSDNDDYSSSQGPKQNQVQVKGVTSDPFEGHEPKSAFDDGEPKSTFDEEEPKESFVAPESGSTKDDYVIPDIPKDAFKDAYSGANKGAFEVPKAAFGEQEKDFDGIDGYGEYQRESSAPKAQHEQIVVKQVQKPVVVAPVAATTPLGYELSFDKGRKEDVYKSIYDKPVEREQESKRKVKHKQETREDIEHEEESRQEFKQQNDHRALTGGQGSHADISDHSLFGGNDHSKGHENNGAHSNNHEYHSGALGLEHLSHGHGQNHGRSHGSHANLGSHIGHHGSHIGHHGSHSGHHGSHSGHHGSHGNLGSSHHSSGIGSHGSHSHHHPQATNNNDYDTSSSEGGSHESSYEIGNDAQQNKDEPANINTFYDPENPLNHKVESRKEYKRGDHVIGEYTAKGSDGVYRKVKYQSGPHTGFETVYNVQAVAAPRGGT